MCHRIMCIHYYFLFIILFYTVCAKASNISIPISNGNLENYQKNLSSLNGNNSPMSIENVSRFNRQLDLAVESKFRISMNTIIRTGESRELGAKYLNETVLPSNRDCLTWCLETPNCNAVVYEEKNVHSCYMFDCGSPATFLCKFTTHNFFISSILKITHHSYDLSQWGNQVKHEKELAELRSSDIAVNSSSLASIDQNAVTTSTLPTSFGRFGKAGSKCHHYQFQCVNNSECIAIYNVCDGIPQCPDGSDESTDLKCHMKAVNKEFPKSLERPIETLYHSENKASNSHIGPQKLSPPSTTLNTIQNAQMSQSYDKHKMQGNKEGSRHTENTKVALPGRLPTSRGDYYHHVDESDGLGSPFVHKHSQFVAANDARVPNRWSNDYDQLTQHSISSEPQYNPYESNYQRMDEQYAPNQLPPEYDSVKGYNGYRQEDGPYWPNQDNVQDGAYPVDVADFQQPGLRTLNKQNVYPDKDAMYVQQTARTAQQYPETRHRTMLKPMDIMPAMQQSRSSEIDDYKSRRFPLQRQQPYLAYDESLQRQLANYPDIKTKSIEPLQNIDDSFYNDDLIRASLVNQLEPDEPHHHSEHDLNHFEETAIPISKTEGNLQRKAIPKEDDSLIIVKPTSHTRAVQKTVLDFKMSVTELYQSSRTHTQEANSAILALVMGLIITFLLFVLLACRMKTIRRRMSRKGRALAHDADYLVNGMYL